MKIKESCNRIKFSALATLFLCSFFALATIRVMMVATYIDASTGFYTKDSVLTLVFYVAFAAACLAFGVCSFLSSKSADITVGKTKNKAVFVAALMFSLVLFYDGVSSFFGCLLNASETQMTYTSVFKSLMVSGSIPLFLRSVFAVFSGVFFVIFALSYKKGDAAASKHTILALMPVGWSSSRLLQLFVRKISFVRVSDLLLELCMCAFMVLFFMALAQVSSGVYSTDSRWRIPGFGYSAALFAAVISVSRLIFTLLNKDAYINSEHPFSIVDLVFAIFVLVLIFAVTLNTSPQTTEEEEENGIVS